MSDPAWSTVRLAAATNPEVVENIEQEALAQWVPELAQEVLRLRGEVARLEARELNALRLLLMAQHNWSWSAVCDTDITAARIMTRTSAPLEGGHPRE